MDIFMPIAICVIFIILFSICGWCCKRKREGTVYGYGPSVTVTSTTQQIPAAQPVPLPYPVTAQHPTPATNAPGFGYPAHQAPYPTHQPNMPFPHAAPTPYPPTVATPYPPAPYPPASHDYSANPPPYDVAVSQPPVQQLVKDGYGKQSPYNPGYN